MSIINACNITKDYGQGQGIFDVSIDVKKGETFGFLGPNGAGKTTTIRNLMGFIRPDSGSCSIMGRDCFKEAAAIQSKLGYLAGEIAFFDDMTGKQLIQFLAEMKGVTGVRDKNRMMELMEMFELDPRGKVRKMSKGMKQKVGIIVAFMNDPEVIILDEPTSGLDPLMQNRFIDLVLEEKKKGKTILLSSHIFEEVERTCDRTAIIRAGRIVALEDMESLGKKKQKTYIVTFDSLESAEKAVKDTKDLVIEKIEGKKIYVRSNGDVNAFLQKIGQYPIKDLDIRTQSLEEIFMHYYGREEK